MRRPSLRPAQRLLLAARSTLAQGGMRIRRLVESSPLAPLTPLGWTVLIGGVLCATAGWPLGWAELQVIALFATLVLLAAVVFVRRRCDLQVQLDLPRRRVQIGDDALGKVVVTGREGARTAAQALELPVGRATARLDVPALTDRSEHEELFGVPTRRRCVLPIGPVSGVRGDPLGLLRRATVLTEQVEIFVHPPVAPVAQGAIGFLRDIEGVTSANLSSSDVSFHALRDYVPGDDRRAVHWRTTARTGRLVVRQFEETLRAHLLVLLSLDPADYSDDADLELGISVAASLGAAALREQRRVTVHTTSGPLPFPSLVGLLDELSRVLPAPGVGLRAAAAQAVAATPDASVAAVVTGSRTGPGELRATEIVLPAGMQCFAVRVAAGGSVGRSVFGRLTVIDIARLGDVTHAVRAVR